MNNYRKRGSSVVSALASRAKASGINPGVGKGISVSEYASFRVICRDNNKRVSRPSDRDVNWSPPPHPAPHMCRESHLLCRLKNPTVIQNDYF